MKHKLLMFLIFLLSITAGSIYASMPVKPENPIYAIFIVMAGFYSLKILFS